MSDSTSHPYFSADFGELGGRFDWMTHEEITSWIEQLKNGWGWIGQQRHDPCNRAWQAIAQGFQAPIQALTHAQNHRNQGQAQQAESNLGSARSSLENFIRSNPWLLPKNARKGFVEVLRDSGQPLEAALIVAHWMGQDFNGAPIRQAVNALLAWELHERGIKDRMKTESAALKRLAGDMQGALTQIEGTERTQIERFDDLHVRLTEQKNTHQSEFETTQTLRDSQWQELQTKIQGELDQLKETYDKHMALAAPVEYWKAKRSRHKWLSIASFTALCVCMGVVGYFLHTELQSLSKVALNVKTTEPIGMQATLQTATAWQFGAFILMATLGFWFIRLLVRIFLSNLHLENDAAERVTMAQTYLALLRDGSLAKDSISTVLAALFRPTGDGIVKDEGLPPTAMEWLTKLGGK